ncbi:MAG: TlpA family protein disulfide reductase [Bacteroidota bacterium]
MKIIFVLILGLAVWVVVAQPSAKAQPNETWYHAEITLAAEGHPSWTLPFDVCAVRSGSGAAQWCLVNGAERIPLAYAGSNSEGYEQFEIPFYSGRLIWRKEGKDLVGFWLRPDQGSQFALRLSSGTRARFAGIDASTALPRQPLQLKYRLRFHHADQPAEQGSKGIAVLTEHADGRVTGTIMTESGDYRYLAGNRISNRVYLSTFNGVFAYVFALELGPDGSILGTHFISSTRQQRITGVADPDARLADPTSLSSMKPGVESLTFSLPHYQPGELFGPELGKPSVIQIMGSWCPNCVDESNAFKQFDAAYPDVQFFGITFERSADREQALPAVDKFVRGLDLRYPILFGGRAERGAVERTLEGLANFHSYPTTIYLDKQGKVRKIYSGFYGPGTPEYAPWLEETQAFIEKLRAE